MKAKLSLMKLNKKDKLARKNMCRVLAVSICWENSSCACGCSGSSDTYWNGAANLEGGMHSPGYNYDNCEDHSIVC